MLRGTISLYLQEDYLELQKYASNVVLVYGGGYIASLSDGGWNL